MYIFCFFHFDNFFSVKFCFLKFFLPSKFHLKFFLNHKKMSEFIFLRKRQKNFLKTEKKCCRKIDRTGASRTVGRKLAVPGIFTSLYFADFKYEIKLHQIHVNSNISNV